MLSTLHSLRTPIGIPGIKAWLKGLLIARHPFHSLLAKRPDFRRKPLLSYCSKVVIRFVTVALFVIVSLEARAQSQSVITGKVVTENDSAATGTTIRLLSEKDSSFIQGVIVNEDGIYNFFKVAPGAYLISATLVGYKQAFSRLTITKTGSGYEQPLIKLFQDAQLMAVAYIKVPKSSVRYEIDRIIIDIAKSPLAGGMTALDALERSPGVTVDRQGNSLSLNGKSSVMVMINGRLNRMPIDALLQQLAGMSTSTIDRIELMTIPHSGQDAEGDAGLINIILRKNIEDGLNGSFSVALGYSYVGKGAASGNINYRSGKLSLFGEYSYTVDYLWQRWQFDWQTGQGQTLASSNSLAFRDAVMPMHTARAGIEYALNKHITLTGMLSGFDNRWRMDAKSSNQEKQSGQTMSGSVTTNEINHWQHMMENLGVKYVSKKTELTFDTDFLHYSNRQPTGYMNNFQSTNPSLTTPYQLDIDKRTPFSMWVIKADWAQGLKKGWKLETGFKRSDLSLRNDVLTRHKTYATSGWEYDPDFSQRATMSELIHAGYVNITGSLAKKWKLQAGLRAEATRTLLTTAENIPVVDRNYVNLFPSLFITYAPSDQRTLQFSYSRRITRPPYKVLAPTMIFIGPNTLRTGNPAIQPTLTHALQVNYRFNDIYTLSTRYSYDKNQFFDYQPQIVRTDSTVRQVFNTQNIDKTHALTTTFSVPLRITSWWQSQSQAMAIWQQSNTRYGDSYLSFSQFYGQINTNNTFRLWKNMTAEVNAFYNTPSQAMGVFRRKAYGSLSAGIQYAFNKSTSLRANISDLLWTNKRIGTYTVDSEGIKSYSSVIYEPRIVRISYTQNFGSQKIKSASRRKTGSEEERERAN